MTVEKRDNEIVITFPKGTSDKKIEAILKYLQYESLMESSAATQEDADALAAEAKKGRWQRIKKEIGFED